MTNKRRQGTAEFPMHPNLDEDATKSRAKEQKEFEAWANSELAEWLCPYVEDLKEYMGEVMQAAWLAWQARGRMR